MINSSHKSKKIYFVAPTMKSKRFNPNEIDTSEFEYGCPSICPSWIPSALSYNASLSLTVCSQLQTNMTRTEVGQSRDTVHMQCILDNNIWKRNFAFQLMSFMVNFLHLKKVLIQSLKFELNVFGDVFVCMHVAY